MPSKEVELNYELKKNGNNAIYLEHYIRANSMKDDIHDQYKRMLSSNLVLSKSLCSTRYYLPNKMIDHYPIPTVSLEIIATNARG
jgi:hypothetical protein